MNQNRETATRQQQEPKNQIDSGHAKERRADAGKITARTRTKIDTGKTNSGQWPL
jgi:hypothetical protein